MPMAKSRVSFTDKWEESGPSPTPRPNTFVSEDDPDSEPPPINLGPKRKMPPKTGPWDIIFGVSVQIVRSYLFINVRSRLLAYVLLIFVGSLISPFLPLPQGIYFAQKHNFLNQIFVKWSWGWTLIATSGFIYLTAMVYSSGDKRNVRQQGARMVVGTIVWFFATSLFVNIQKRTAFCTLKSKAVNLDKESCEGRGGSWFGGFDISGHAFLLLYCCLLIVEEVKVFRNWDRMRILLDTYEDEPPELSLLSPEEVVVSKTLHDEYTIWIKFLFLGLGVLQFIWEFMLFITVCYYHTFIHKVLGAGVAIFFWLLTYGIWYRTPTSPGLPGHCKIRYSNWRRSGRRRSRPSS